MIFDDCSYDWDSSCGVSDASVITSSIIVIIINYHTHYHQMAVSRCRSSSTLLDRNEIAKVMIVMMVISILRIWW